MKDKVKGREKSVWKGHREISEDRSLTKVINVDKKKTEKEIIICSWRKGKVTADTR